MKAQLISASTVQCRQQGQSLASAANTDSCRALIENSFKGPSPTPTQPQPNTFFISPLHWGKACRNRWDTRSNPGYLWCHQMRHSGMLFGWQKKSVKRIRGWGKVGRRENGLGGEILLARQSSQLAKRLPMEWWNRSCCTGILAALYFSFIFMWIKRTLHLSGSHVL